jgi:hypothetical protein
MGVNRDGHLVYTAMGSKNDLSIPWEAAVKLDGGTWTHVHPVNLPLSMEDVATAIHLNMAEIRAVANDNGNMVTYSIKPESGGKWPNRETFAWNVMGTRDELALHVGGPKDAYNYWNNFWKSLAPRVGLVYEVHS